MKKKILLIGTVILCLLSLEQPMTAEPEISAKSAIVIENSTGIVLYSKNCDEILPMASTTKLMTALIAVESEKLDTEMTVSEKASAVEGSQMGLLPGQKLTLKDLLYMLLLKSANDAAEVIAENIAGTTDAFVDLMNQRAADLGCSNTHFANVHGLPNNEHYTTASDLSVIASTALKNNIVRQIVGTKTKKLDYFGIVIKNSNKLFDLYQYTCGMKTGYTKSAGRCLVSAATKDDITLIAVTLNAPDDWNDHIKILDYGFSRITRKTVVETESFSAEIPILNGTSNAALTNTQSLDTLEIDGVELTFQLERDLPKMLFAPVDSGKTAGRVYLKINGLTFDSSPLAVIETVSEQYVEMTLIERFLNILKKILILGKVN